MALMGTKCPSAEFQGYPHPQIPPKEFPASSGNGLGPSLPYLPLLPTALKARLPAWRCLLSVWVLVPWGRGLQLTCSEVRLGFQRA